MILHLYVARRFLWLLARILIGFFALMVMIDLVEELRRFAGQGIGLGEALVLALINVPATFYKILPLLVLLSAIGLFLGLARSSELVVARAAGRSGLTILAAPAAAAFLFGLFAISLLDPLVAATSRRYDAVSQGQSRSGALMSVGDSGLWLRQASEEGQTVIAARRASLDGTQLYDVTFLDFSADGAPLSRIEAREAQLEDGAWRLTGAKSWLLTAINPEREAEILPEGAVLSTDLTLQRIRSGFGTPGAIGFWDLPNYINDLRRAGFSAHGYEVWYQMELAQPLFLAAMVLLAGGFTMGHARLAPTGVLALGAVLTGFAVFFLRNFGQVLGENGQIPVVLAAWAPPSVALLLALGLLLHLEEG
jgi:lipopolysaccharide export system permease protein